MGHFASWRLQRLLASSAVGSLTDVLADYSLNSLFGGHVVITAVDRVLVEVFSLVQMGAYL